MIASSGPLTTNIMPFEVTTSEFTDLVDSPGPFDFNNATGLALEFFTNPGTTSPVGAFEFRVDDLEIGLMPMPEPSTATLGCAALGALVLLRRLRRVQG